MTNCAKVFSSLGQLLILLFIIAQCLLLASFPARYLDDSAWYTSFFLITPTLIISWWWINTSEKKMIQVFCIWFSYTWFGLVPMIGIVFGLTVEKLDTSQQFNPMVLKLSLGITPLLVMLLLHTGAVPRNRRNMINVSFLMAIDVFDSNELLRTVIDENVESTHSFRIPRSFVRALLSFACIGLLFSPLEMLVILADEEEDDASALFKFLNGVIQVCLNVIVLGLRLGILRYEWDASMFIAKNIIMTFARALECVSILRDEEVERDAEEARRRNTTPPPTAPPAALAVAIP